MNCGQNPHRQIFQGLDPVGKLLIPLASLLSGVSMLVIGTGLLFAAIGAQAGSAKFSGLVTGLIMSAYFAGFVYGTMCW